jgi:hypothetical protein
LGQRGTGSTILVEWAVFGLGKPNDAEALTVGGSYASPELKLFTFVRTIANPKQRSTRIEKKPGLFKKQFRKQAKKR